MFARKMFQLMFGVMLMSVVQISSAERPRQDEFFRNSLIVNLQCDDGQSFRLWLGKRANSGVAGKPYKIGISYDLSLFKNYYIYIEYDDGGHEEAQLKQGQYSTPITKSPTQIKNVKCSVKSIKNQSNKKKNGPLYTTSMEVLGPHTAALYIFNKTEKWLKCSGYYFVRASDPRTGQWQTNTSCAWGGGAHCGPINARPGMSEHRIPINQPWQINRIQVLDFSCSVADNRLLNQ